MATAYEKQLAKIKADPVRRKRFEEGLARTEAIDAIIRALDEARVDLGMSKAEVARRIDMQPATLRKLFTSEQANPTLKTVAALAEALGLRLQLVSEDQAA